VCDCGHDFFGDSDEIPNRPIDAQQQ
jgi:hypothetical protein